MWAQRLRVMFPYNSADPEKCLRQWNQSEERWHSDPTGYPIRSCFSSGNPSICLPQLYPHSVTKVDEDYSPEESNTGALWFKQSLIRFIISISFLLTTLSELPLLLWLLSMAYACWNGESPSCKTTPKRKDWKISESATRRAIWKLFKSGRSWRRLR